MTKKDLPILYHMPLSPFARKIRIVLAEKRIEFDLQVEKIWERRQEFLAMNPAGDIPVLVDNGLTVCDSDNICAYIEEKQPDPPLLGDDIAQRIEVRRLVAWFDKKFNAEVTNYLVGEKLFKRLMRQGHPEGKCIRAGHANIKYHLDYIVYLTDKRNWLAGDHFSLADITAASHISCLDYIGDIPWDQYPQVKDWYTRIKSRKSFRALLDDYIPGSAPVEHYANMDF